MAATLLSFRPTGIRACATSGHRKPDPNHRKASSSNWWTPLFGWSSDPDYIDDEDNSNSNKTTDTSERKRIRSVSDPDTTPSRSRFAPGSFTEEKAKQLRMKTMETTTFHDIMYHSAIASRLASDLPDSSDR
ncbi:hypothetical protein HHK36_006101 [Tetracentron sinense]|uniref:Uncharacterized protein n=1 Tax=Tetracentron sinense TaxID=13715 RepID=A0A834ZJT7_TETSI|nr:hypothetical protein HHK36_006101 [Tetracentron sinense]